MFVHEIFRNINTLSERCHSLEKELANRNDCDEARANRISDIMGLKLAKHSLGIHSEIDKLRTDRAILDRKTVEEIYEALSALEDRLDAMEKKADMQVLELGEYTGKTGESVEQLLTRVNYHEKVHEELYECLDIVNQHVLRTQESIVIPTELSDYAYYTDRKEK
jgi:hypothetical protein